MNLTFAVTVYNRYEMLLESFAGIIDDPRIDEVLIMDDASDEKYWQKIEQLPKFNRKIKVIRQLQNRKMQQNKADAISYSKNDWVIIFDSDNQMDKTYLDALPSELFADTIYMPDFAKPQFSFKEYSGLLFNKSNVKSFIHNPSFNVLLNCCNYVVNKHEYLKAYKYNPDIDGADTINMAKNWLLAGNNFFVVPSMEYYHKIHDGSQFMKGIDKNMADAQIIRKEISRL